MMFNDQQRLGIAKIMNAPDFAVIDGPGGTGKSVLLGAACGLSVRRGERVLISSQTNVAVDKIFDCLPREPEIRGLRIGRKEAESSYSEDRVVDTWLSSVRDTCREALMKEQQLASDLEQVERTWPRFAETVGEQNNMVKFRRSVQKKLQTIDAKFGKLTTTLSKLNHQHSEYSSAAAALEQVQKQLRSCSTVIDPADWVKLIDSPQRANIFNPLRAGQGSNPLPDVIQPLLAGPPSESGESCDSAESSNKSSLLDRFVKLLAPREQELPPSSNVIEPTWSVEWITSNNRLNRLRALQTNLPDLLELCQEAERLCTVTALATSEVSEASWLEVTGALSARLKSSGTVLADILQIENIATALRPKKRFAAELAKAGGFLQQVLAAIPAAIDDLQKALTTVVKSSAKYFSNQLTKISKQIQQTQSKIDCLKDQQDELGASLSEINEQFKRLESVWEETYETLPVDVKARTPDGVPPFGSQGLKMLKRLRTSYVRGSEETVKHHKCWGPIQDTWVRRLETPTEADRKRLTPLYVQRCNIVGATCSWCGNWRHFLSRQECSKFDVVIVDECSKVTPPELVMAAILGRKVILCGDYRQLPPTFKEGRNLEHTYNELADTDPDFEQAARFQDMVTASLFKKLYHDCPDILKQHLSVVFRFPSQIREIVNQFYDGKLEAGFDDSNERFDHGLTIKTRSGDLLTPQNHVLWVDTSCDEKHRRVRERQVGNGKANDTEAEGVVRLVKLLNEAVAQAGKAPGSVELGIITFYAAQLHLIRSKLDKVSLKDKKFLSIRVATVDDFQGQEQEIVILSMVRSKPGQIGNFARSFERINVAMSRAERLLLVLGAVDTFAKVEVPLPTDNGKTLNRRCYANILDIVKKYGGTRNVADLL